MMYLAVFSLSYLACVVFYHSGKKRSAWPLLRQSPALRGGGYAIGGCLMLLALIVAATGQGWERGIPLWLGFISAAGILSLLLAVMRPRIHLWSSPVVLGVCLLTLGWGVIA